MNDTEASADFELLLEHLKHGRGFDFTGYKRMSLMRRIHKRMQTVGIDDYGDYLDYLEVHPQEFSHLFNTILINVTGFFRDAPAWEYLEAEILPQIAAKEASEPIRVWNAGCSSGEESYTVAMLLAERLGAEAFRGRVKIYATDVDADALNQARQASYASKDVQGVPRDLLDRYFEPIGDRFVFRKDLRRGVIFGRHDLIQDAPISRVDLLVCRNTLMYFNAEAQARILSHFHFALNEGGFLFLGKAEMLLTHADTFTPVDLKRRVFRKTAGGEAWERLLAFAPARRKEDPGSEDSRQLVREAAFDISPVAQVVVDKPDGAAPPGSPRASSSGEPGGGRAVQPPTSGRDEGSARA